MEKTELNDIYVKKIMDFFYEKLDTASFEQWIYSTPELENFFGSSLYLEIIEADFDENISYIRKLLADFLGTPLPCDCLDLDNSWEGDEPFSVEKIKSAEEPFEWVNLFRCRACKQWWQNFIDVYSDIRWWDKLSKSDGENFAEKNPWVIDLKINDYKNYEPILRAISRCYLKAYIV